METEAKPAIQFCLDIWQRDTYDILWSCREQGLMAVKRGLLVEFLPQMVIHGQVTWEWSLPIFLRRWCKSMFIGINRKSRYYDPTVPCFDHGLYIYIGFGNVRGLLLKSAWNIRFYTGAFYIYSIHATCYKHPPGWYGMTLPWLPSRRGFCIRSSRLMWQSPCLSIRLQTTMSETHWTSLGMDQKSKLRYHLTHRDC